MMGLVYAPLLPLIFCVAPSSPQSLVRCELIPIDMEGQYLCGPLACRILIHDTHSLGS